MKSTLFSLRGRISRSSFWKGIAVMFVVNAVSGILTAVVTTASQVQGDDGATHIGGVAAAVLAAVGLAVFVFDVWAGLGLAVKRYHDRDKSGWWVLIQLVPLVGAVWYFIETGFLTGSEGTNRFGPDPRSGRQPEIAFA
jgi:uncharacterized membrane protein YhaH (DUF805 family)